MQEKLSEVTLILFGSTAIILLLTGLIVLSLFIHQKRKYRFRQEKLIMQTNFDQELLRSQLEIQSQAFESISRELHDNVGTLISIAVVHIKSLDAGIHEKEQQRIAEADSLLNEAMTSLRDISRSIHPENISRLGWQQSFINELERIRKTNIFTVEYKEEGESVNIELSKQVIIFRILQETLNNIVKHSNGNHIHAQIRFTADTVTIIIGDDGQGFVQSGDQQGLGIKNMTARAAMLPAHFSIEKAEQCGTVVTLSYTESPAKTADHD
jgi:two-component system, NarL family, sensor kinase